MTITPLGPIRVGEAVVTLLNPVHLRHSIPDSLDLKEEDWKGRYDETLFRDWIAVPVQAALIQVEGATVLVDAPSADLGDETDLLIPGYTPPPSLVHQLADLGVSPEEITHIVITHTHFDHFNGLAAMEHGRPVALYPKARLLVGPSDWETHATREGFGEGAFPAARMLLPYHQGKQVQFVENELKLGRGGEAEVVVFPSPGETLGHLSVAVRSQGKTLYCVGDLYHHWVEAENRDWVVGWAQRELTIAERARFEEQALAEDAMVMASHIHGLGRLARTPHGIRWQELAIT